MWGTASITFFSMFPNSAMQKVRLAEFLLEKNILLIRLIVNGPFLH